MIEYRAALRVDKQFEGGLSLKHGTVIYARETKHGWLGSYYPDPAKPTTHCFALDSDEFSIFQIADYQEEELVVIPLPPDAPEDVAKARELQLRRLRFRIQRHREEADTLEKTFFPEGIPDAV